MSIKLLFLVLGLKLKQYVRLPKIFISFFIILFLFIFFFFLYYFILVFHFFLIFFFSFYFREAVLLKLKQYARLSNEVKYIKVIIYTM